MTEHRISLNELCATFSFKYADLAEDVFSMFHRADTAYREAHLDEYKEYILHVLKLIDTSIIARGREENLDSFEKGWEENLRLLLARGLSTESLKPKYFKKNKFLRYNKKLIVSENLDLEYDLFTLSRYLIFSKHLKPYQKIYELGSGSCQNLLMLSELFPEKELYGLDWTKTSKEIASTLAKMTGRQISGHVFDMFKPREDFVIEKGSAVITIHAMEQLGTSYERLLSFILNSKPAIVVHYEPITEFYDHEDLLDYLALKYSNKRNYLSYYYTALRNLQRENKIKIIEAFRPYIGGVIHESSLISWKPV